MNSIMYDGKKSSPNNIIYGALIQIEAKAKADPLGVFRLRSTMSRRRSKSARARRRRHLPGAGRSSSRRRQALDPLASHARAPATTRRWWNAWPELLDAFEQPRQRGQESEDIHRMAEANRAFSHYRW